MLSFLFGAIFGFLFLLMGMIFCKEETLIELLKMIKQARDNLKR